MPVERIYSFLTYPKKSRPEEAVVSGTQIPLDDGKLCKMLKGIFDGAGNDCSASVSSLNDPDQYGRE